jgi:hypothetical protein
MYKTNIDRLWDVCEYESYVGRQKGFTFLACHTAACSLILSNHDVIVLISEGRDMMYITPKLCDICNEYDIKILNYNRMKLYIDTSHGRINFIVTNKLSHNDKVINSILSDTYTYSKFRGIDDYFIIPMGHQD